MTARETPEAACARGEAAACTVAALRVLPSVDKARSEQKAVGEARALFEKGCRGGDPESCRHLGLLLAEGRIYSADLPAAKELLSRGCTIGDDRVRWVEEACRLGRMDACLDAAERRQNGNGVPVDMKLALQNYQAACRLSNAPSCFRAAKILRSGDGVKADPKAAAVWYDKACQMRQTRACAILGDLYLSGEGVDKDDVRARFYHNIACSSGLRSSCPKAGR